jgi:hypothetical protein
MGRPIPFELGVLGEDGRLEPLQFGAWLDPELTDQHLASARDGLQRLGLAPGSVQGDHKLAPPPLAERLLPDHGLELGDQLTCISGSEPRIDQILARRASQLLEPVAFGRAEARVPVALVCGAAPEIERLPEQRFGFPRVPLIEEAVSIAGELLERDRVDLMSGDSERVAASAREDDVRVRAAGRAGLKGATEPRNVGPESLLRGPRWMLAPQLLDEIVDGHDTTRAGDQASEDHAFLRSGDRQRIPAFRHDLEGSEDEETHTSRLARLAEQGSASNPDMESARNI